MEVRREAYEQTTRPCRHERAIHCRREARCGSTNADNASSFSQTLLQLRRWPQTDQQANQRKEAHEQEQRSCGNAPLQMVCSKDIALALITEKMFISQVRSLLMCQAFSQSCRKAGSKNLGSIPISIPKRNVQGACGHHAVVVRSKSPSCPLAEAVADGAFRIHPIGVDTLRNRDVLALVPAS